MLNCVTHEPTHAVLLYIQYIVECRCCHNLLRILLTFFIFYLYSQPGPSVLQYGTLYSVHCLYSFHRAICRPSYRPVWSQLCQDSNPGQVDLVAGTLITTKVWGLWRPCSPATFYALNIILRDIGIRTRDTSSLIGCASIELLLCRQSHAPNHHQRRVHQGEVQLWPHLDCTVPLPCTAAPDTVLVQGAYIVVQYTTYTGLLSRNTKYTSGTACVSVLHTHYFILRKGSLCVFLT